VPVFWVLGIAASVQDVQNALECEAEFCPAVQLRARLNEGLDWRPNAICLPPEWTERWYRFRVAIVPTGDPLEVFDPPRTVLLDRFEVSLDERCPTGAD
jgi:hypothetical protein